MYGGGCGSGGMSGMGGSGVGDGSGCATLLVDSLLLRGRPRFFLSGGLPRFFNSTPSGAA